MHDLRDYEVGGKRTCEPGENGRQHPKECEFENIGPQYVRSRCAENLEDDSVINTRPMPGGNGGGKHEDTGGNRQTGGAFQGQSDIAQFEQGLTGPIANVTVRRHEHSCAFWSSTCCRRAVPFRRYCVMPAAFNAIYPRLVEKHGVLLYPFFLDGVALDPALNQRDLIHPNRAGVAVIVERIAPFLRRLIEGAAAGG